MRPPRVIHNAADCSPRDSVGGGERFMRYATIAVFASNIDHIAGGQLSQVGRLTSNKRLGASDRTMCGPMRVASFVSHIGQIIYDSPQPEMPKAGAGNPAHNIDARFIVLSADGHVTCVTDDPTVRNWQARRDVPRQTMGAERNATAITVQLEEGIPLPISLPCPTPATALPDDLVLVLGGWVNLTPQVTAFTAAVTGTVGLTSLDGEGRLAVQTGKLNAHPEPPTLGVTPRAVASSAGVSCVNYTSSIQVETA